MKRKFIPIAVLAVAAGVAIALFRLRSADATSERPDAVHATEGTVTAPAKGDDPTAATSAGHAGKKRPKQVVHVAENAPQADDDSDEEDTKTSAEAVRAAKEEEIVDDFDATVDKWMESKQTATMDDVEKFRDAFRRIPKDRKDECLHRALNLIPDENVMLLAGILFDKTQDKELIELVYNDILNRGDAVKQPILSEIFKDKDHPNWADTAWILDVTNSQSDGEKQSGDEEDSDDGEE